jgi:hypothetical protein
MFKKRRRMSERCLWGMWFREVICFRRFEDLNLCLVDDFDGEGELPRLQRVLKFGYRTTERKFAICCSVEPSEKLSENRQIWYLYTLIVKNIHCQQKVISPREKPFHLMQNLIENAVLMQINADLMQFKCIIAHFFM